MGDLKVLIMIVLTGRSLCSGGVFIKGKSSLSILSGTSV